MDYIPALERLSAASGVTGREAAAADAVLGEFKALCDDTWRDRNGSVFARMGEGRPVVLLAAHLDEVGLMITGIEENGFLRIRSVSGVDPRVLPGSRVVIDGAREIPGVIGAAPLVLVTDRSKSYQMSELFIDTGLKPETVSEIVRVGDIARFASDKPLKLKNGYVASKSLDNRAHIAAFLGIMGYIKNIRLNCTVIFCASVQEEFDSLGARGAAWDLRPDIAIALDVTHGQLPDATKHFSFPMDKVVLTTGPEVHPKLLKLIKEAAKDINIPFEMESAVSHSGTDVHDIQTIAGGMATAVISTPLRYMHTSVEVIDAKTLDNCAKLTAHFLARIDEKWEEALCLDD